MFDDERKEKNVSSTDGNETREDDHQSDYDATAEERPDHTPPQAPGELKEGGGQSGTTDRSIDVVRAAKNEIFLREYNERIQAHHKWVGAALPEWACECANKNCPQPVLLSIEEYEAIRAEPTHFVIAPSSEHVNPEIERVVKREERYWVLEKVGVGAAVAEVFDPRSP